MSHSILPQSLELQLFYGELLVADLHEAYPHQGTWFARCELKISPGEGPLQDGLLEYITFSEEFDRRIEHGEEHDFTEFDRYDSIADTASWRVPRPDGGALPME